MTKPEAAHAPTGELRRLFIDVTETVMKREWTGIGRVVRRLSAELAHLPEQGGPAVHLVAAFDGRFHPLNATGVARLSERTAVPARADQGRVAHFIGGAMARTPALYIALYSLLKQRRFRPVLSALIETRPVSFHAGDAVLLLDAYWGGMTSPSAARRARREGATVVAAIYDLIPVTHPTYMVQAVATAFPILLLRTLRISTGALAISAQSALELRRFLGNRLPQLPIHSFKLGNDAAAGTRQPAENDRCRYAMVGTIEPRKGHDLVLDAFERRWAAGADCVLTIVGKLGWTSPAMEERLHNHPQAGGLLQVRHDVGDAELADILASADAVIQASQVEGFGLPIVEALANGTAVIASDIPVFREIGGAAMLYFAPGDVGSLEQALITFESERFRFRTLAESFRWPSWHESAIAVLGLIRELVRTADPRPPADAIAPVSR